MSQCSGCSVSFDVDVVVNSSPTNTVVFTVSADPCCNLTDTKMKKAVLVTAICSYVSDNSATILSIDPNLYNQLQDKCCRCDSFRNMVWDFSANEVTVSMASVVGLSGDTITVTAPYTEVNT